MAAVAKKPAGDAKQFNFAWTGKDKAGKVVKGELRAQIVSFVREKDGLTWGMKGEKVD